MNVSKGAKEIFNFYSIPSDSIPKDVKRDILQNVFNNFKFIEGPKNNKTEYVITDVRDDFEVRDGDPRNPIRKGDYTVLLKENGVFMNYRMKLIHVLDNILHLRSSPNYSLVKNMLLQEIERIKSDHYSKLGLTMANVFEKNNIPREIAQRWGTQRRSKRRKKRSTRKRRRSRRP